MIMETQYSIVQNSTGGGLNALVLRSWYINEEGEQITIKSEVKTGLTMEQCFDLMKQFVDETKNIERNG
jgi:hypothetical protein